jgi:hypothetical protein
VDEQPFDALIEEAEHWEKYTASIDYEEEKIRKVHCKK